MKKQRRALLWIGGAHTGRKVILPDSVIHLLDRRFPGETLVVHARGLQPSGVVRHSVIGRGLKTPALQRFGVGRVSRPRTRPYEDRV